MEEAAPVLLSGGNPQIAKGNGADVVERYLAAMPGWKQDVGRCLDRLIVETVPGVHKMIRWNTPFYGPDFSSWFVGFHCLTRSIKVAFPQGAALDPVPPGTSRQQTVRYLDIPETGNFDQALFAHWITQASTLPVERF